MISGCLINWKNNWPLCKNMNMISFIPTMDTVELRNALLEVMSDHSL